MTRRTDHDEPAILASVLLGEPVERVEVVGGGGNNRLYKVFSAQGEFALKRYPAPGLRGPATGLQGEETQRDRLEREFTFLRFLNDGDITDAPEAINGNGRDRCALYTWIDGQKVSQPAEADIDAMLEFLARIHAQRQRPEATQIGPASDAVFSIQSALDQLDRRLRRLQAVAPDQPLLAAFLQERLLPEMARITAPLLARADRAEPLAEPLRTPSPSDFGLHNALRRRSGPLAGRLAFLDFEYAGWDDPVKLSADTALHPGMRLSPPLKARFLHGAIRLYSAAGDAGFTTRLHALYPLFGLIWRMILLNEFLPEGWRRRQQANPEREREPALIRQLAKARALPIDLSEALAGTESAPP